jgi:hypothetical protein
MEAATKRKMNQLSNALIFVWFLALGSLFIWKSNVRNDVKKKNESSKINLVITNTTK